VNHTALEPTSNRSHCPYKGIADHYWSVSEQPDALDRTACSCWAKCSSSSGRRREEVTEMALPVDVAGILRTMGSHQVRRLPVIDGHDLIGMVAVADVARALSDRPVGDLIDAISKP